MDKETVMKDSLSRCGGYDPCGDYTGHLPVPPVDLDPNEFGVYERASRGHFQLHWVKAGEYLRRTGYISMPGPAGDIYYRFNGRFFERIGKEGVGDAVDRLVYSNPLCKPASKSLKENIACLLSTRTQSEGFIAGHPPIMDLSKWYIMFNNGRYSPEDDTLYPFTPSVFEDHAMEVDLKRIDSHPVEGIYDRILPDAYSRDLFFLALGYTLYSESMYPPAIFMLHGPRCSGKSALLNVMKAILGTDLFVEGRITDISSRRFRMDDPLGKKAMICENVCSPIFDPWDHGLLCMMASGKTASVSRPYGSTEDIRNTAKIWCEVREIPQLPDAQDNILRMIYPICCSGPLDNDDYRRLFTPDALSYAAYRALYGFITAGTRCHSGILEGYSTLGDDLGTGSPGHILESFITEYTGETDMGHIQTRLDGVPITSVYRDYTDFCVRSQTAPCIGRRTFVKDVCVRYRVSTRKKSIRVGNNTTSRMVFSKMD